jgi:putative peptidoglycan lipid II flippase
VTRLGLACAAMVAVLLALLHGMSGFTEMDKWHRMGNLALLVGGGGLTYLVALVAMGFRPRHLREH